MNHRPTPLPASRLGLTAASASGPPPPQSQPPTVSENKLFLSQLYYIILYFVDWLIHCIYRTRIRFLPSLPNINVIIIIIIIIGRSFYFYYLFSIHSHHHCSLSVVSFVFVSLWQCNSRYTVRVIIGGGGGISYITSHNTTTCNRY